MVLDNKLACMEKSCILWAVRSIKATLRAVMDCQRRKNGDLSEDNMGDDGGAGGSDQRLW